MLDGAVAAKATVYNDSSAKKVSDYGARVQKIYAEKPWPNWNNEKSAMPWFIPPSPWATYEIPAIDEDYRCDIDSFRTFIERAGLGYSFRSQSAGRIA